MIFVSCFPITKILFTKKKKSRLPCDNLAHAYNIHDRQYTFELTNHYIFSREPSRVPMMALFKYFKRSNPLPLSEGPLSMKVAQSSIQAANYLPLAT